MQEAGWGDNIYLNGSGTEHHPYSCRSKASVSRRIHVKASITFKGHVATAHVSCSEGFFFEDTTGGEAGRGVRVVLSNIAFRNTRLMFRKCSHLAILGCAFRGIPVKAINFRGPPVRGNTSFFVKTTTFENNALCIFVDFTGNITRNTNAMVTIVNTTFKGNGRAKSGRTGGIVIANTTRTKGPITIHVSCTNVVYTENRGPLITIDHPEAITHESYDNIQLLRNEANPRSSYKNGFWRSLCVFRVRRSSTNFSSIHCENNSDIRCLGFASQEANLKIRDSFFSRQKVEGKGGALYIGRVDNSVTLDMRNNFFMECTAQEGGALYVDKGSGTVNLNMYNVTFNACHASTAGSAMAVGGHAETKQSTGGIRELYASLRKVTIKKCYTGDLVQSYKKHHSKRQYGAMCLYIREHGKIEVEQSIWYGNLAPSCAAVMIGNTHGKVDVHILESEFVKNYSPTLCVFCTASLIPAAGSVTFHNTFISKSNESALCLSPLYKVVLSNVTITASKYAALVLKLNSGILAKHIAPYRVDTEIRNCTFLDNPINILCTVNRSNRFNFDSRDTVFLGSSSPQIHANEALAYSVRIEIKFSRKVNASNPPKARIIFENVTFNSTNPALFYFKSKGDKTVLFKSSVFRHSTIQCLGHKGECNAHGDNVQMAGAVTMLFRPDKPKSNGCISKKTHQNTHPTWSYDSSVVFEETTFEENEGFLAGAVFVGNGYAVFRRCSFRNNFSLRKGGHVSFPAGTGKMEFAACNFTQTTTLSRPNRKAPGPTYFQFLYSESSGPLTLTNTTLVSNVSTNEPHSVFQVTHGGYVDIHPSTQINCSVGNKLSLENNTHYIGTYIDQSCQLNRTVLTYSCSLCPPWMYTLQVGSSQGLTIEKEFRCLPCPYGATCFLNVAAKSNFYGYLVSKNPPALNFSTCPAEYCRPPQTSDTSVFNGCRGNRTGLLCGRCRDGFTESLFSRECREISECGRPWFWFLAVALMVALAGYLVIKPPLVQIVRKHIFWWRCSSRERQHTNSGYLKITFYFYQVADILLVDSLAEVTSRAPFILPLVGMFTFQVKVFDQRFGCPFAGLTVVTKELFLSMGFFTVLMCIAMTYVAHLFVNHIRDREKPRLISYLAVAMETLLLGYECLAETTLKLLHCVRIGSEWRLFYDANVLCWKWWQYVFLAYGVTFLVPFIAVLYWGSLLLHRRRISTKEFLVACVFPLPFLLRWTLLQVIKPSKDPVPNVHSDSEVLEVLHGPFRPPTQHTHGSLHWESVLIGRRFVLLSLQAFISNPMVRLAGMTAVCVFITVHHAIKAPYQDPKANDLETVSLASLTILGIINLSRAAFVATGVVPDGPSQTFFIVLQRVEIVFLGLVPGIFVFLVALAILSQMLRFLVILIKYGKFFVRVASEVRGGRPHGYQSESEDTPLFGDRGNERWWWRNHGTFTKETSEE